MKDVEMVSEWWWVGVKKIEGVRGKEEGKRELVSQKTCLK